VALAASCCALAVTRRNSASLLLSCSAVPPTVLMLDALLVSVLLGDILLADGLLNDALHVVLIGMFRLVLEADALRTEELRTDGLVGLEAERLEVTGV
jgi:hypothetical protein